jgi:hypothetical protein
MVYKYVVVLKNQQNRYIDVLGIILSLFSVFCFINEIIIEPGITVACLLGSIAIILVLAWNIWQSLKKKKVYYSRSLLIAALVWMKMPYFNWLVFVFIILAFLEYQAKYALEIGFSDNEIIINTLFKKKYKWKQFSNIVLKDDLLTLDFTNNRLFQRQVEDDEDYEADEDEFNEYCSKQLQSAHERQ